MLGFCSSTRFTEHHTGAIHPERPDRIRAIWTALSAAGYLASPNPYPTFTLDFGPLPQARHKLVELSFSPADPKWLATVHSTRHIKRIEHMSLMGGGILDSGDTVAGPDSYEIAVLAVGATLRACDAVMTEEVTRCFVAERPPGHHAEPDRPMGFCLFNNVAIAAKYLQRTYGVERIAIVDFDVHHGNGTQMCFEDDPSVYYASLHQHPQTLYPGTGYDWEIGVGPGQGFTLNMPFNPGAGDEEYLSAVHTRIVPALEQYRPQVMLLSAGFDAHRDDPMAQIDLSEDAFETMTRALASVMEHDGKGRIISVLEGGYNLRALGRSVVRHLMGLGLYHA
ncbi:MAG TPA: histone deacetylase, partial [Tepidisphaeraceae bacterium]|nr:histone deacetylase [Tepidisphaeraceae bacterium]